MRMILKVSFLYILQLYFFQTILVDSIFADGTENPLNDSCGVPGPVSSFDVSRAHGFPMPYLELKWGGPIEFLQCVDRYEISLSSSHPGRLGYETITNVLTWSTPERSIEIEGIKPCTNHTFSIVALDKQNRSISTNVPTVTAETGPARVINFNATNITTSSVTVTWDLPADGGLSCASHFELMFRSRRFWGENPTPTPIKLDLNKTSYTMSNLKTCDVLEISLRAKGAHIYSEAETSATTGLKGPPGPVESFNVTNVTSTEVELIWSKPSNNSDCLPDYEIQWLDDFGRVDREISSRLYSDFSYTASYLNSCTNYTFSISAVNTIGRSKWTNVSATTSPVPGEVKNLKVTHVTATSITITWDKPDHGIMCARQYKLDYNKMHLAGDYGRYYWEAGPSLASIQVDLNQTSYTISGLDPCVNYQFGVATTGDQFNSKRETTSSHTLPEVPGPVESFHVAHVSRYPIFEYIRVEWTEPKKFPQCIDYYKLSWFKYHGRSEIESANIKWKINRSYDIDRLELCTNYTIQIMAVSGAGNSIPYNLSSAILTAPGEVYNLNATEITAHSMTVQWKGPYRALNCASHFELFYKPKSQQHYSPVNKIDLKQTSYTIDNLEACVEYEIDVRANGTHYSSDVTKMYAITREEAPSEVRNLAVTNVTATSITVIWDKPLHGFYCAEKYELDYFDFDKNEISPVIPIELNETSYTINNLNTTNKYEIGIRITGSAGISEKVYVDKGTIKAYIRFLLLPGFFVIGILSVYFINRKKLIQKLFNGKRNWTSWCPKRNNEGKGANGEELNGTSLDQRERLYEGSEVLLKTNKPEYDIT